MEEIFNIKKSKLSNKTGEKNIKLFYESEYERLIKNNDFQGCLDLFNSGRLDIKPRSIGYAVSDKDQLRSLMKNFNNRDFFHFDLNWIDVSNLTDLSYCLRNFKKFNCNISEWNVSNVTNMDSMFYDCVKFSHPILNWDVSNVANMRMMFWGCTDFNGQIGNWVVSNVTNMQGMFGYCHRFNEAIENWDVSKVETIEDMFTECHVFNRPLSNWKLPKSCHYTGCIRYCFAFEHENLPPLCRGI